MMFHKDENMGLLPCPFCEGEPLVARVGNEHTKTRKIVVKCGSCRIQRTDATFKFDFAWLERVATEQWNKRTEQTEGN